MALSDIIVNNKDHFEELLGTFLDPYDLGIEVMRQYLIAEGKADPGKVGEIVESLEYRKYSLDNFPRFLLKEISEHTGCSQSSILDGGKKTEIAIPRHIFRVLHEKVTGLQPSDCRRLINDNLNPKSHTLYNHSSFYHSRKAIEGILMNKKWKLIYENIYRDATKYYSEIQKG